MTPQSDVPLAPWCTLGIGGPARWFIEAASEEAIRSALAWAHAREVAVYVLGGGSNVVVADDGFDGLVIKVDIRGVSRSKSNGRVNFVVGAGEAWDPFVATTVAEDCAGLECLSGIPGLVGGTPIQNVGAYGQEVSETLARVRVWDRLLRGVRTFANADCGFGYRTSRFKVQPGRFVVLSVTFQLPTGSLGAPVKYAELARSLGTEQGQRAPLEDVRRTVLGLRAGKGMVLDAADHDTWSAGSFFTNPFLTAEESDALPEDAPRWPQPDGSVKTSAAWLIERAGFDKGYGNELVSLSTKHTLAVTNRGEATTGDLLALAREVRDGVEAKFGVQLVNEPVLVGCAL